MSMFPDSRNLDFHGGAFTSAQTVDNSITHYNITYIFSGDNGYMVKSPLPSKGDAPVENADIKIDKATGIATSPMGNLEPTTPPEPIPGLTKQIIIYTNIDIARKKLKRPVQIIFTLTPLTGCRGSRQWSSIVWKMLSFQPSTPMYEKIMWSSESAFALGAEKDDGSLKPGDLSVIVQPKSMAIMKTIDDNLDFSEQVEVPIQVDQIALSNASNFNKRFLLCSKDPTKPETDELSPVVDLGHIKVEEVVVCGIPVMLQAYAVSGYKERMPIDTGKLQRPLFVDTDFNSRPIDLRTLNSATAFRLYSSPTGRIMLERD
ncbi:hypothetical protein BDQ12DRAFT_685627 [Crucibulum laeve]|uniref:Uncharacterized protein n=1 Tax=Crucibulum laeve TaxID=68775 RepID=A0A5C3LVP2_9AGAR|nr:hypothetical protein BDQ12DRAFT_685627 [Crucibulum laeve]